MDKLVNVNKVARNVNAIGQFALFQVEGVNLVATHWFMLNVNEEQFWKIRCKLEARDINCWLVKSKDGLNKCEGYNAENAYALYSGLVYEQTKDLDQTGLILNGQIMLLSNAHRYYGILTRHLEMINYTPTIRAAYGRESVIVDDVHVFTAVKQENTESKYLKTIAELMRG